MNPYYLTTDALNYSFNGYSSGSGTSSPAGMNPALAQSKPAVPAPAPAPAPLTGPLVSPHQDLNDFLESFWTRQMDGVERETPDFKTYNLPLARIKKVMKSDEEVKMISAEAPIMFSKACEIFISELTCRAWLVAEGHKRRTLQKSDVASAIAFSDVFDFLIDIVPRDDGTEHAVPAAAASNHAEPEPQAPEPEWPRHEDEHEGDALYSEYVQGEGEGFA
ncbi:hypothetical protein CcaverHIS641_0501150 [Cutaneotrichosporon cavernicola]|nr:hypothetical protein CcaverHIS641_0501150 [Cutaneotrichosporon cavernicola]